MKSSSKHRAGGRLIRRIWRYLGPSRPIEDGSLPYWSDESKNNVEGLKAIAARLLMSPRRLRELRDPDHPDYDARIAAVIESHGGRHYANAKTLAELAAKRWVETSEQRKRAVGNRRR